MKRQKDGASAKTGRHGGLDMKRSTRGFTLVELLVVMAIISILASIVVPNVINYIRQSRAVKARADIASMESSLVKILSDSGRSSLQQLFNPGNAGTGVNGILGITPGQFITPDQFGRAIELYSRCIYGMLRDGRGVLANDYQIGGNFSGNMRSVLNEGVVKRLGTSYIEVTFDPWGNLYNIYPGPWPATNGPIPFRKYRSETSASAGQALPGKGDSPDPLTFIAFDPVSETSSEISFPAARDKVAFIWSAGENSVSGQAIYSPQGYGPVDVNADKSIYYDTATNGDVSLVGGGDDVNNWDNGSSWSPFY